MKQMLLPFDRSAAAWPFPSAERLGGTVWRVAGAATPGASPDAAAGRA